MCILVFEDIVFGIDFGEFVVIMGILGLGKIILLNIMGGFDCDYWGYVLVGLNEFVKFDEK